MTSDVRIVNVLRVNLKFHWKITLVEASKIINNYLISLLEHFFENRLIMDSQMYQWHPSDPSGACVRTNSAGVKYEEFSCLYPWIEKTLTP